MPDFDVEHIYDLGNQWIKMGDRIQEGLQRIDSAVASDLATSWQSKAGRAAVTAWGAGGQGGVRGSLAAAAKTAWGIGNAINDYADGVKQTQDQIERHKLAGAIAALIGLVMAAAMFIPHVAAFIGRIGDLVGKAVAGLVQTLKNVLPSTLETVTAVGSFVGGLLVNTGIAIAGDLGGQAAGAKAAGIPLKIDWKMFAANLIISIESFVFMGGADGLGPVIKGGNLPKPDVSGAHVPDVKPVNAPHLDPVTPGPKVDGAAIPQVSALKPPGAVTSSAGTPPPSLGITPQGRPGALGASDRPLAVEPAPGNGFQRPGQGGPQSTPVEAPPVTSRPATGSRVPDAFLDGPPRPPRDEFAPEPHSVTDPPVIETALGATPTPHESSASAAVGVPGTAAGGRGHLEGAPVSGVAGERNAAGAPGVETRAGAGSPGEDVVAVGEGLHPDSPYGVGRPALGETGPSLRAGGGPDEAPAAHGVGDPVMHGVGDPVVHGVGESVTHGVGDPVVHGVGESVTHGVGEPVTHGVGESVAHGVGEPVTHGVGESVAHGVGDPVVHGAGESVAHGVGDPVVHGVGESVTHSVGDFGRGPRDAVHGAGNPVTHGTDDLVTHGVGDSAHSGAEPGMTSHRTPDPILGAVPRSGGPDATGAAGPVHDAPRRAADRAWEEGESETARSGSDWSDGLLGENHRPDPAGGESVVSSGHQSPSRERLRDSTLSAPDLGRRNGTLDPVEDMTHWVNSQLQKAQQPRRTPQEVADALQHVRSQRHVPTDIKGQANAIAEHFMEVSGGLPGGARRLDAPASSAHSGEAPGASGSGARDAASSRSDAGSPGQGSSAHPGAESPTAAVRHDDGPGTSGGREGDELSLFSGGREGDELSLFSGGREGDELSLFSGGREGDELSLFSGGREGDELSLFSGGREGDELSLFSGGREGDELSLFSGGREGDELSLFSGDRDAGAAGDGVAAPDGGRAAEGAARSSEQGHRPNGKDDAAAADSGSPSNQSRDTRTTDEATKGSVWRDFLRNQKDRLLNRVKAEEFLEMDAASLESAWQRGYDRFVAADEFGLANMARDGHEVAYAKSHWRHGITDAFRKEIEQSGGLSESSFNRIKNDAMNNAHKYLERANQIERLVSRYTREVNEFRENAGPFRNALPKFDEAPRNYSFDSKFNTYVRDDAKVYGLPKDLDERPIIKPGADGEHDVFIEYRNDPKAPVDHFRDKTHDFNPLEQHFIGKMERFNEAFNRYLTSHDVDSMPVGLQHEIDGLTHGLREDLYGIAQREHVIDSMTRDLFEAIVEPHGLSEESVRQIHGDFQQNLREGYHEVYGSERPRDPLDGVRWDMRPERDLQLAYRPVDKWKNVLSEEFIKGPVGEGMLDALWDAKVERAMRDLPVRIEREQFVRGRLDEEKAYAEGVLSRLPGGIRSRLGEDGSQRILGEYSRHVRQVATEHYNDMLSNPEGAKSGVTWWDKSRDALGGATGDAHGGRSGAPDWDTTRDNLHSALADTIRHERALQRVVNDAARDFHNVVGHPDETEAHQFGDVTRERLGADFRTERVKLYDELFAPKSHNTNDWLAHESRHQDRFVNTLEELRSLPSDMPHSGVVKPRVGREHGASVSPDRGAGQSVKPPAAEGAGDSVRPDSAAGAGQPVKPPAAGSQGSSVRSESGAGAEHAAGHDQVQLTVPREDVGASAVSRSGLSSHGRAADAGNLSGEVRSGASKSPQQSGPTTDAGVVERVGQYLRRNTDFVFSAEQAGAAHESLLASKPSLGELPVQLQAEAVGRSLIRDVERFQRAVNGSLERYGVGYIDGVEVQAVRGQLAQERGAGFLGETNAFQAEAIASRVLEDRLLSHSFPGVTADQIGEVIRQLLEERGPGAWGADPQARADAISDRVTRLQQLAAEVDLWWLIRAGARVTFGEVARAFNSLTLEHGPAWQELERDDQVEALAAELLRQDPLKFERYVDVESLRPDDGLARGASARQQESQTADRSAQTEPAGLPWLLESVVSRLLGQHGQRVTASELGHLYERLGREYGASLLEQPLTAQAEVMAWRMRRDNDLALQANLSLARQDDYRTGHVTWQQAGTVDAQLLEDRGHRPWEDPQARADAVIDRVTRVQQVAADVDRWWRARAGVRVTFGDVARAFSGLTLEHGTAWQELRHVSRVEALAAELVRQQPAKFERYAEEVAHVDVESMLVTERAVVWLRKNTEIAVPREWIRDLHRSLRRGDSSYSTRSVDGQAQEVGGLLQRYMQQLQKGTDDILLRSGSERIDLSELQIVHQDVAQELGGEFLLRPFERQAEAVAERVVRLRSLTGPVNRFLHTDVRDAVSFAAVAKAFGDLTREPGGHRWLSAEDRVLVPSLAAKVADSGRIREVDDEIGEAGAAHGPLDSGVGQDAAQTQAEPAQEPASTTEEHRPHQDEWLFLEVKRLLREVDLEVTLHEVSEARQALEQDSAVFAKSDVKARAGMIAGHLRGITHTGLPGGARTQEDEHTFDVPAQGRRGRLNVPVALPLDELGGFEPLEESLDDEFRHEVDGQTRTEFEMTAISESFDENGEPLSVEFGPTTVGDLYGAFEDELYDEESPSAEWFTGRDVPGSPLVTGGTVDLDGFSEFVRLMRPLREHVERAIDNPAADIEVALVTHPGGQTWQEFLGEGMVGHSLVSVLLPGASMPVTLGFYPAEDGMFNVQGRIDDDTDYLRSDETRVLNTWWVTAEQLLRGYQYAVAHSGAVYDVLRENCVVFAGEFISTVLGRRGPDMLVPAPYVLMSTMAQRYGAWEWADGAAPLVDLAPEDVSRHQAADAWLRRESNVTHADYDRASRKAWSWVRFDHQRPLIAPNRTRTSVQSQQLALLARFETLITHSILTEGDEAARALSHELGEKYGTLRPGRSALPEPSRTHEEVPVTPSQMREIFTEIDDMLDEMLEPAASAAPAQAEPALQAPEAYDGVLGLPDTSLIDYLTDAHAGPDTAPQEIDPEVFAHFVEYTRPLQQYAQEAIDSDLQDITLLRGTRGAGAGAFLSVWLPDPAVPVTFVAGEAGELTVAHGLLEGDHDSPVMIEDVTTVTARQLWNAHRRAMEELPVWLADGGVFIERFLGAALESAAEPVFGAAEAVDTRGTEADHAAPVQGSVVPRPLGAAGGLVALRPQEELRSAYGWLEEVNPHRAEGGGFETNCVLTAIAVDLSLRDGGVHQASPSDAGAVREVAGETSGLRNYLENYLDRVPDPVTGAGAIVTAMSAAPIGARGMVVIENAEGGIDHVVNVTHDHNGVVFLDGQAGFPVHAPEGVVSFLPTTEGVPGHPLRDFRTVTDGTPARLLGATRPADAASEETSGLVEETAPGLPRPVQDASDLDVERRPQLITTPLPVPLVTGPVRFTDGAQLPLYMTGGVGSELPGLPQDVVARSFAFGQGSRTLRGTDLVVRELEARLDQSAGTRPASAGKGRALDRSGLLDEVGRGLRHNPQGFFGDGARFVYEAADGETRTLEVTARPYGNWERFAPGYGNPVKIDTMQRSTGTGGQVKVNGHSVGLAPTAPLGPFGRALSAWGRVHVLFNFSKRVRYDQRRQVVNQTETRTTDGSHVHLDDVWFGFSVKDRHGTLVDQTGRPVVQGEDTARQPAVFHLAVRHGLMVRIADSLTVAKASTDALPTTMTLDAHSHFRMVNTEAFGPVSHIRDWAMEQTGASPGSVTASQIGEFFSTGGFHAMSRTLHSGPVVSPPLFGGKNGRVPLGVFSVKVESGQAVLINETTAAELRDTLQSTARNERQIGTSRHSEIGVAVGPAVQLFGLENGAFDLRMLAGLTARYGASSSRSTLSGGAAAVKIGAQAKGATTGLYLVQKTVTVTAPPARAEEGWSGKLRRNAARYAGLPPRTQTFQTWAVERLTRTEARRLAGLDKDKPVGPKPSAPPYLSENEPATLGMSRVEEFTFADGSVSRVVDGKQVTFPERFADEVLRQVGEAYPGLVAPLRELDPGSPRWRDADHFTTVLHNTVEVLDQLSHRSMASNLETMMTTGLRIDLTQAGRWSHGHRYVWVDAKLTGRRYEGKEDDLRLRFSAPGSEVVGGRQSGAHGWQAGAEALVSLRDTDSNEIGRPEQLGTASVGARTGRRAESESGYGRAATHEAMSIGTSGSHLYSYQVSLSAQRGGYWRPRRWMRGLLFMNALGTQPFVFAEPQSPLIAAPAQDGVQDAPGLGRVLLSVPAEHTPVAPVATTDHTVRAPEVLSAEDARDLALDRGQVPAGTAGGVTSTVRLSEHPHETVAVTAHERLTGALEEVLQEASGGSWTVTRKGAPAHDAALQLTESRNLRANFDQSSSTTGWRAPELFALSPYMNRSTWLAHRTTVLPGMTALTSAVKIETETTVGGLAQAAGRNARTGTVFFGGQVGYQRTHDVGTGVTGTYALVASPYRLDISDSKTVRRAAVSEINRKDTGFHVLAAAPVRHEIAAASERIGAWAHGTGHLPASLVGASGRRLVVPDGWVGHLPEKSAYRLGVLKDGFGDVPLYDKVAWSPLPVLRGQAFGSWPVNSLDTAAALRRFEEKLEPLGLSTQDLEQLRRLVQGRVMRALGREMAGPGAAVPARIGRWGSEWAQTWIGERPARLRAQLVPVKEAGAFGGLGHSVELEEHRQAVESVQQVHGRSSGRLIGITVSEGAHTSDSVAKSAGPTYSQMGTSVQGTAQTLTDGTITYSTVTTTQAHGEYATEYELRLELEITDTRTAAPAAAGQTSADRLRGRADRWARMVTGRRRHSIAVQENVGRLVEHFPLSLMRPEPRDGAGQSDPLAPPSLEQRGEPHRVALPQSFGAGGWHDVAHRGAGGKTEVKPFEMPQEGFAVRGVVGLDGLHTANTLALGAAYDASLSVPEHGPLSADLLARAKDTPLTRAGTGSAQSLEDGTSNSALAAFYEQTLTPGGYQVAGLTDRGLFGGADGSLTIYSKPDLSGARLLAVADGIKFEGAKRDVHGGGSSATRFGGSDHVLQAGPTTSSPALGTNQIGSGSGAQEGDSVTAGQAGERISSVNVKPDKARAFLFAIPAKWLSIAQVHHHVKDSTPVRAVRSVFGNPQRVPQAVEADATVLAWVREDVARQMGLVDGDNFPAKVAESWDEVGKADKVWTAADKAYWGLRRGDAVKREAELAAAEEVLSALTHGDARSVPTVEDALEELHALERDGEWAEPAHDGWEQVRSEQIERARTTVGLARRVAAAQDARDAAQQRLDEVKADLETRRAAADALAEEYARVREAADRLTNWYRMQASPQDRKLIKDIPEPPKAVFSPPSPVSAAKAGASQKGKEADRAGLAGSAGAFRSLGAGDGVVALRPLDELVAEYGWLEQVNPHRAQGGDFETNCVLTAIAVDLTLGDADGAVHQAPPSKAGGDRLVAEDASGLRNYLENYLDRVPDPVSGPQAVVAVMSAAPVGSRGMVVVENAAGGIGHVVNVTHDRNGVVFLDGQSGRPVHAPDGVVSFLPTTDGIPGHPLQHATTTTTTAPPRTLGAPVTQSSHAERVAEGRPGLADTADSRAARNQSHLVYRVPFERGHRDALSPEGLAEVAGIARTLVDVGTRSWGRGMPVPRVEVVGHGNGQLGLRRQLRADETAEMRASVTAEQLRTQIEDLLRGYGVDAPKPEYFHVTHRAAENRGGREAEVVVEFHPRKVALGGQGTDEVPKLLHFIWLGGKMRSGAEQNLAQWVDRGAASGWSVQLWTDSGARTANRALLQALAGRGVQAGMIDGSLFARHHADDPAAADKLQRLFLFAMQNNAYTMASDIARYEILYRHGGAYLDVDIAPGDIALPTRPLSMDRGGVPLFAPELPYAETLRDTIDSIDTELLESGQRVPSRTRAQELADAANWRYDRGSINNNLIVAPPRNTFLREALRNLPDSSDPKIATLAERGTLSRKAAALTGPWFMREQIKRELHREFGAGLQGYSFADTGYHAYNRAFAQKYVAFDHHHRHVWTPVAWLTEESEIRIDVPAQAPPSGGSTMRTPSGTPPKAVFSPPSPVSAAEAGASQKGKEADRAGLAGSAGAFRSLGAGDGVVALRPLDELVAEYGWLEQVNPHRAQGGDFETNCVLTAIAVDLTLGDADGAVHQAPPSKAGGDRLVAEDASGLRNYLENYLDRVPDPVSGPQAVVAVMSAAPVGSRGMVVVENAAGGIGHVVNVTHDRNGVVFLDGQSGRPVHAPDGVVSFLPTTDGIPGHPLQHATTTTTTAPPRTLGAPVTQSSHAERVAEGRPGLAETVDSPVAHAAASHEEPQVTAVSAPDGVLAETSLRTARDEAMAEYAGAAGELAEALSSRWAVQERIAGAGSSADAQSADAHQQRLAAAESRFDAAERRMVELGLGDLSGRDDLLLPDVLRELTAPQFRAAMDKAEELLGAPAVVVGSEQHVGLMRDAHRVAQIAVAAELVHRGDAAARVIAEEFSQQLGTRPNRALGGALTVGGVNLTERFRNMTKRLEEEHESELRELRNRIEGKTREEAAADNVTVTDWIFERLGWSSPHAGPQGDRESVRQLQEEIAQLPDRMLTRQKEFLADQILTVERSLRQERHDRALTAEERRAYARDRDRIRKQLARLIVEPTGHRGHHAVLDTEVGKHPDFGAKRREVNVETYTDLARGLLGWIAAKPGRHEEKELALRVESEGHVEQLLDVLLTRLHTHVRGLQDGERMLGEMESGVSHHDGRELGAYLRHFRAQNLPEDLRHLATSVWDRGGMAGVLRDPAGFGIRDKMMVLHGLMEYFKKSPHYPVTYGTGMLPPNREEEAQSTTGVDEHGLRTSSSMDRGRSRTHPSTRDENADSTILARDLGIPVWAGQSFTALRMFKLADWAGASAHEIAAVAWGIFAFWRLHYNHRGKLAYHTLHETLDIAQNFGVPYSLRDRAAGLPEVTVEGLLASAADEGADFARLARTAGEAVEALSQSGVPKGWGKALAQLDEAAADLADVAVEIERRVDLLRPLLGEGLTEPGIRVMIEMVDFLRAGQGPRGAVLAHRDLVLRGLTLGGSRDHGLDPQAEGWETGREITITAERHGLPQPRLEQPFTVPRDGKGAEVFHPFSRPFLHASRSYGYEVGSAGTVLLPDGTALRGGWTRFGDDFLHEQGYVLRGDNGWIGRVANWEELRAVLPRDAAAYELAADESRMYVVPVDGTDPAVVLPLTGERAEAVTRGQSADATGTRHEEAGEQVRPAEEAPLEQPESRVPAVTGAPAVQDAAAEVVVAEPLILHMDQILTDLGVAATDAGALASLGGSLAEHLTAHWGSQAPGEVTLVVDVARQPVGAVSVAVNHAANALQTTIQVRLGEGGPLVNFCPS